LFHDFGWILRAEDSTAERAAMGLAGLLLRLTGGGFMRIFLALCLVIVALAAWFAMGLGRKPRPDASLPTGASSTTADPASSGTELDPTAVSEASARSTEAVSSPTVALAPAPACRVFGRVVDSRGAVVTGAQVSLRFLGDKARKEERFESVTGVDGRFLIETPPPAKEARLRVTASEFLSIGERAFGSSSGQELAQLVAGDNDLGDIGLAACGVVAGRAVSEAGLPVPGVPIAIRGDTFADSDRTGEDGRYRTGRFSAGRYAVTIEPGEWLSSDKFVVDVAEMQVTEVPDIVVRRATTITGTVTDEAGAPAAKVIIRAYTKDGAALTYAKSATDGSFTFYLPRPEAFTLELVTTGEFEPWGGVLGDPRFTFEHGTRGVRIVLTRVPGMTFRVVDAATRAPIERFGIRAAPRDPPGVMNSKHMRDLALEDHPRGEARLPVPPDALVAVTAPDHADLEIPFALDAGAKDVQTIAMSRPSGITGRVRIARTPIKGAALHLFRDTFDAARLPSERVGSMGKGMRSDVAGFPGRPRTSETNDAGSFAFTALAPGTYALSVESAGAGKKWLRMLVVPPEDVLLLGDVELDAEAIVRGVILTGPSESPLGFEIEADDHPTYTVQGADGRFEFRGLSAGPFSFYWHRPDQNVGTWPGDPKRFAFDLRAGETRDVVIDASHSAPCTLRVQVHKGGKPAADVAVNARIETQPTGKGWRSSYLATTDATGMAVGRVEGGTRITVEALSSAKRVVARTAVPLDTVAGGDVSCSLDVAVGTLTVELLATMAVPEHGRVILAIDDETLAVAVTGRARGDGQPLWSTNTIEFGECAAGTHGAELKFERFERDTASDNPKAGRWVPLREPFETLVEIKEGEATRVVVP
jgi:hypothetical protein